MKLIALVAAATLMSTPAFAENWVSLGTNPSGNKIAVDLDSVEANMGYAAINAGVGFTKPDANGATTLKTRLFFSCITATYDVIQASSYDSKGKVLATVEKNSFAELKMSPIEANSIAEVIGKYACSK